MATRYFLIGSNPNYSLAKIENHTHWYLNKVTCEWEPDPPEDEPIGFGEGDPMEISPLAAEYLKKLFCGFGASPPNQPAPDIAGNS